MKDVGPENPEKVKAAEKKVRARGSYSHIESLTYCIFVVKAVWRTVSPCIGGKAGEVL